jgi:hypothetical protein
MFSDEMIYDRSTLSHNKLFLLTTYLGHQSDLYMDDEVTTRPNDSARPTPTDGVRLVPLKLAENVEPLILSIQYIRWSETQDGARSDQTVSLL